MRLHIDWSLSSEEVEKAITASVKNLTEPNSDFSDDYIEVKNTDASSLRDMAKALEKAAMKLERSDN
jgi:TATA-box binding protein (TBP) (component of TFIID and TFIIIB)